MSVKILSRVWEEFPGDGSELLAMLALADWSDDNGQCFPSISSIARKIRLSRSQTQRIIHKLIDDGYVVVTANSLGGSPAQTRHYRIVLSRFTGGMHSTPAGSMDATGCTDATGSAHAQEGSHPCGGRGSAHATQTVIEPSLTVSNTPRIKKSAITLNRFLETCKQNSEQAIPEDDPVFEYAETVGLEVEMIAVCWQEFKTYYLAKQKRYKDWRQVFRNCVRGNWKKLWFMKAGECPQWTTAGEQARRVAA